MGFGLEVDLIRQAHELDLLTTPYVFNPDEARAMAEAGHINADFATMDSGTCNDPFFNGQGGIIADVSSRGQQLMGLFKDADPEGYADKVTMVGNLKNPDGTLWALPTPGYSGYLSIPKAAVPGDAQATRATQAPQSERLNWTWMRGLPSGNRKARQ